jgi:hypothetical protein
MGAVFGRDGGADEPQFGTTCSSALRREIGRRASDDAAELKKVQKIQGATESSGARQRVMQT